MPVVSNFQVFVAHLRTRISKMILEKMKGLNKSRQAMAGVSQWPSKQARVTWLAIDSAMLSQQNVTA